MEVTGGGNFKLDRERKRERKGKFFFFSIMKKNDLLYW